jgi:tRNA threonylcarbamoyl adenosine modification protein YeaZ
MDATSPLILALETSVGRGSVALLLDETILSASEGGVARAEDLLTAVRNILDRTGNSLNDVGRLAISVGPGSYTGIRIGIASAFGLRRALGLTLFGVSTLAALAFSHGRGDCVSAIPIGRGRVAVQQFYQIDAMTVGSPRVVTSNELAREIRDCAHQNYFLYHELIESRDFSSEVLELPNVQFSTSNLASLIGRFAASGGGGKVEPIYL